MPSFSPPVAAAASWPQLAVAHGARGGETGGCRRTSAYPTPPPWQPRSTAAAASSWGRPPRRRLPPLPPVCCAVGQKYSSAKSSPRASVRHRLTVPLLRLSGPLRPTPHAHFRAAMENRCNRQRQPPTTGHRAGGAAHSPPTPLAVPPLLCTCALGGRHCARRCGRAREQRLCCQRSLRGGGGGGGTTAARLLGR